MHTIMHGKYYIYKHLSTMKMKQEMLSKKDHFFLFGHCVVDVVSYFLVYEKEFLQKKKK